MLAGHPTDTSFDTDTSGSAQSVDQEIREHVTELASSLSRLLGALPTPIRRAPDLVKALGIDNPLACRVLRVAHASDPAEAIEFFPTLNQVRRVIQRSAELAPGPAADEALDAMSRFDELVNELGIDQRGFESLVSSLTPKGVRRVELQHRRAAYRANMHLWGVSAETTVSLMLLLPNEQRNGLDLHAILGFVRARVTRPNAVVLGGARLRPKGVTDDAALASESKIISPTDFMPEFSTIRDASLTDYVDKRGFRGTQINFKGVRPKDAETFFVKRSVKNFVTTDTDERCASNTMSLWPTELSHKDMLLPSGLTDPSTLTFECFARREDPRRAFDEDPGDRVPLYEEPRHFAKVTSLPPTMFFPRLNELLDSLAGKELAKGLTFDLYRSQIPFPMLHSLMCLHVMHVPNKSI